MDSTTNTYHTLSAFTVFDTPTPPPCLSSTLSPLYHHPPSSSEMTQNESERYTNVHCLSCASSPGYPQYVLSDRVEEGWHLVGGTLVAPSVCLSKNESEAEDG